MAIPESIKKHKPTQFGAIEIRCFGGNKYYVYRITSKWNAEKKRPQKVTGKSIGKITEADGFIPNATGMKLMQEKGMLPSTTPTVHNYGAYEMLRQLSPKLESELERFFPDFYREIRTIALLRLVEGVTSAKMIRPVFLDSYLSDISGDLALSETSVRNFVSKLGMMQDRLDAFMKAQVMPGTKLLFDGTTIFTRSSDSLSARGYNPNHSLNPQARLLYVFEKNSHKPVFYRVLQGSVVDKVAFMDTIHASGCKDCTLIGDKGFYSKKNLSALMSSGIRFILPLQDNTVNVEPEFYENQDDHKFDGVFTYHKRTIWYRKKESGSKGNFIYTFRDDVRRAGLQERFVECAENDCNEQEKKPMDVIGEVRMGYFSFCSNIDTDPKQIYLDYKERWDIEQCFDYLKNSVLNSASHAHSDDYFRGWAFLNHISLLYFYGLLNALRATKLDDSFSAEDMLKLTKNIYKVSDASGKHVFVSAIQIKTQEALNTLGVTLAIT